VSARASRKLKNCNRCGIRLDPHEVLGRCDDCREVVRQIAKHRYAKRAKKKYWKRRGSLPAALQLAKKKALWSQKEIARECRRCDRPRLADSKWCRTHRDQHRKSSRASMLRLRVRRAYLYLALVAFIVTGRRAR
jgi:ribosomal protein S14